MDGYIDVECGGNDCNDNCNSCYPGATEICTDGNDNDCDGQTDSQDTNCQCPSGQYNPHTYCDGGYCWLVNSCGTWQCFGQENCGNGHGDCVPANSQCTQDDCDDCDALNGFLDPDTCYCWTATPIVIDTLGNGFELTNAAGGVTFEYCAGWESRTTCVDRRKLG
jgi:hypothetical protein